MDAHSIKAHIDFHTYSELVLWPFGYTTADTATGMTAAEAKRFQDLGKAMAATNGYTPEQSSDLYITDGDINDWAWGVHKILSFCAISDKPHCRSIQIIQMRDGYSLELSRLHFSSKKHLSVPHDNLGSAL